MHSLLGSEIAWRRRAEGGRKTEDMKRQDKKGTPASPQKGQDPKEELTSRPTVNSRKKVLTSTDQSALQKKKKTHTPVRSSLNIYISMSFPLSPADLPSHPRLPGQQGATMVTESQWEATNTASVNESCERVISR